MRSQIETEEIDNLLAANPLCDQIVSFLAEHECAMDTVHGISTCWVSCDPIAAKSALDSLVSVGLIEICSLGSGAYYRLTPHPQVSEWIERRRSSSLGQQQHSMGSPDQVPLPIRSGTYVVPNIQ